MKFIEFRQYFSTSRINRYLIASGDSTKRAMAFYKANLKISQAFHPLLGILEVILRNGINDILTLHFRDTDWIINQKNGFMIDPVLTYFNKQSGKAVTNSFLLKEIEKSEKRLNKTGIPVTSGKIIAEQTLGFWTDLFSVHHYKILKGKPIQIFTSLPVNHGRKQVSDELDIIRRFRNRINHNEPICFRGNLINFSDALNAHQSILKILRWINPEIIKFSRDLDHVVKVIESAKRI